MSIHENSLCTCELKGKVACGGSFDHTIISRIRILIFCPALDAFCVFGEFVNFSVIYEDFMVHSTYSPNVLNELNLALS